MKRLRPPVMMTLVVLVILLAGAACATFRSPDEPLPTRVPTLTASPDLRYDSNSHAHSHAYAYSHLYTS